MKVRTMEESHIQNNNTVPVLSYTKDASGYVREVLDLGSAGAATAPCYQRSLVSVLNSKANILRSKDARGPECRVLRLLFCPGVEFGVLTARHAN